MSIRGELAPGVETVEPLTPTPQLPTKENTSHILFGRDTFKVRTGVAFEQEDLDFRIESSREGGTQVHIDQGVHGCFTVYVYSNAWVPRVVRHHDES